MQKNCRALLPDSTCFLISAGLSLVRKLSSLKLSRLQVSSYKHLKKLVAVDVTDKTSCVVVCGYVGGVLGEDVAYYLIYGVVALLDESVIDDSEILFQLCFLIFVDGKRHSLVEHIISLLTGKLLTIYYTLNVDIMQGNTKIFPDLTV